MGYRLMKWEKSYKTYYYKIQIKLIITLLWINLILKIPISHISSNNFNYYPKSNPISLISLSQPNNIILIFNSLIKSINNHLHKPLLSISSNILPYKLWIQINYIQHYSIYLNSLFNWLPFGLLSIMFL